MVRSKLLKTQHCDFHLFDILRCTSNSKLPVLEFFPVCHPVVGHSVFVEYGISDRLDLLPMTSLLGFFCLFQVTLLALHVFSFRFFFLILIVASFLTTTYPY